MNAKIAPEHLDRGAVVYVRQSTPAQVLDNTESRRRQYALAESARTMGFSAIATIDEDLGRSGSGLVERPGFQKLVASVCAGLVGAVFCIEASRLARNGRDWHHLIDLCALVGTLVIDPDGVYGPRLVNDRLLLGLKGTMSEYELSLLRQRGLEARDAKARRGELRFALPPGYCWDALGRIEMDPDERVVEMIRLVFRKFQELGSARQVLLWAKQADLELPVLRQSPMGHRIGWQAPAYHTVLQMLQHPIYAGAVAAQLLEAVSGHAVEAALRAAEQASQADEGLRLALQRELEQARYEADLAARRYEAVDPAQRLVARWNRALERVAHLEARGVQLEHHAATCPAIDPAALMALAHDLSAAWNAPGTAPRTRQRLTRLLVQEVLIDLDDAAHEAVVLIHWRGGRHTELRVARVRSGRYPDDRHPSPVEVIRKLGGHWPDRELAVTMNRMRCKSADGGSWTTVRVRELRERLNIPPFDPARPTVETITVDETARRLGICVGSVFRLIQEGILPADQRMPCAPWEVPVAALDSEAVKAGLRGIIERRPRKGTVFEEEKNLRLPGF